MIPGVQKPHWLAPVAQNASAQRAGVGQALDVVTISRPATRRAGRDAGDAGCAVDQHRAAAALALRAAAVLHRAHAEPLPQHVEQRPPVVGHLRRVPVHGEGDGSGHDARH